MNKILSCFLLISLGACAMTSEENALSVSESETQKASDVIHQSVQTASEVVVASESKTFPTQKRAVLAEDVTVLPDKKEHDGEKRPNLVSRTFAKMDNPSISSDESVDKLNSSENKSVSKENKKDKSEKSDLSDKNSPPKLNVTLRKQAETDKVNKNHPKNKKKILIPTPKVVVLPKVAPPKPVLTRRQILENEIKREQTALKSAQNQLLQAQKSGNQNAIKRLNLTIHDREQNIQSLKKELVR